MLPGEPKREFRGVCHAVTSCRCRAEENGHLRLPTVRKKARTCSSTGCSSALIAVHRDRCRDDLGEHDQHRVLDSDCHQFLIRRSWPWRPASLVATVIDIRTRRIPNALTATMACSRRRAGRRPESVVCRSLASLAGFALGFALMLPGHALGATGAGDVKLMAAVGAMVGPVTVVTAFAFTAIAGGIMALVACDSSAATRRDARGDRQVHLGTDRGEAADRIGNTIEPVRVRSGNCDGQRARRADWAEAVKRFRSTERHTHYAQPNLRRTRHRYPRRRRVGVRNLQLRQQPAGQDGQHADDSRSSSPQPTCRSAPRSKLTTCR